MGFRREELRLPRWSGTSLEPFLKDSQRLAALALIAEEPTESLDQLWYEALTSLLDCGFPVDELATVEEIILNYQHLPRAGSHAARMLGLLRGRRWRMTGHRTYSPK
jgi:hypothetical protein